MRKHQSRGQPQSRDPAARITGYKFNSRRLGRQ
jgi:hypothetical protein